MLADNLHRDSQSQPGSLVELRGEEWGENPFLKFIAYPSPIVFNFNTDMAIARFQVSSYLHPLMIPGFVFMVNTSIDGI